METLTDRQLRFVYEYLKDQNASAAAVRAGYSGKTRASQASELMNNPAVCECIRIELESLLAELQVSMLDLIKERRKAALFRAEKMFDAAGGVLPLARMEAETREALLVTVVTRKWGPEIRMRQPDRDKALAALEKVHARLERANERHDAKPEPEAAQSAEPKQAPAAWPALQLVQEEAAAVPLPTKPPEPPEIAEKPQVLSGSAISPAEKRPERSPLGGPQVLSGPAVKRTRPSPFAKVWAALSRKKKETPIVRRDPNLLWGGTPKWTPLPPSPYLVEHLARVRHQELNQEVQREMAARGGRIKPGPLPGTMAPGYNPPRPREQRTQFAIGAGECSLDD